MKYFKTLLLLTTFMSVCQISCQEKAEDWPDKEKTDQKDQTTESELTKTCRKMREQITATNSAVSSISATNSNAEKYMNMMKDDGYFSDINYKDKTYVNWQPQKHLERLKPMVISYIRKDSKLYKNNDLYNKIVKGLDYWNRVQPSSNNWWHDQIGEPKLLCALLIMMRSGDKSIPKTIEQNLLSYIEKTGGDPRKQTGANKTDIALHWLYRGCLNENESTIKTATSEAFYPLKYTTQEGIQYDNTYFQHGSQLYIGGYAPVLLNGVSEVALYTAGTEYFMSAEQLNIMYKFVSETLLKSIRNNKIFYNVIGRSVSRANGLNANMSTLVTRMKQTDSSNSAGYAKLLNLIKSGDYSSISETYTNFYIGDYGLYQSSAYSAGVRAYSSRTSKCEKGNGENLKGYFLTEGSMALQISGNEYENTFPIWDWCKIPGITAPLMNNIPSGGSNWEQLGTSDFVGGVSNGKIGSFVYKMNLTENNVDVSANKSWFFWGNEIYCLGNGITSSMSESIATTVNQCNLKEEVVYSKDYSINNLNLDNKVTDTPIDWVWHDNIGYIFPNKEQKVCISAEQRTGSWNDINNSQSTDKVSGNIYALWINHGVTPKNDTYEYILIPGVDKNVMNTYKNNKFEVLSNTEMIQAVYNKQSKVAQAIFYQGGTLKFAETQITVTERCALIVQDKGDNTFVIYVSTPSKNISQLKITLKRGGKSTTHTEMFNDGYHKGKTHTFNLDLN